MPRSTRPTAQFLPRLASLRELLDLLAMLRDFREPIDSPDGLRRAVEMALKLGETLGLDAALLARLRTILTSPVVFEIVLLLLRHGLSLLQTSSHFLTEEVEPPCRQKRRCR